MLAGFCGSGECTGYCPECYEREGEEEMTYAENDGSVAESCSIGHEEIIYFSHRCPLCEALIKIETLSDILEVAVEQLEEIVRITEVAA